MTKPIETSRSKDQLGVVLINPYTIYKSRTGGVISRLFTRTALDLVAAKMFAPSKALAEEYAALAASTGDSQDRKVRELIREYILANYAPDAATGNRRRVMMLVFRGEDAVNKLRDTIGHFDSTKRSIAGETIRDTYGDYIVGPDGEVRYFEPAVLSAPTPEETERTLKLWAKYSDTDGGLLTDVVQYPKNTNVQETLVLLKPDNFRFPSSRPGNIIDMLSRTGLYIIAVKAHRMTLAEGLEFYGPLRAALHERLRDVAGQRARKALENEFQMALPDAAEQALAGVMGPLYADSQFGLCIEFMTGRKPTEEMTNLLNEPGNEKVLALVYQGPDAVAKIRNVLGPTNPSKAPPGTVRKELGQNIMVNAAHASDSPENAQREIGILKMDKGNLKSTIESFYNCKL
jgi:nucleoside diphosphate kinase